MQRMFLEMDQHQLVYLQEEEVDQFIKEHNLPVGQEEVVEVEHKVDLKHKLE
jgi:hypothetical protein